MFVCSWWIGVFGIIVGFPAVGHCFCGLSLYLLVWLVLLSAGFGGLYVAVCGLLLSVTLWACLDSWLFFGFVLVTLFVCVFPVF